MGNEFVMVPRDTIEEICANCCHLPPTKSIISSLNEILAKPTVRQGEPVALPARRDINQADEFKRGIAHGFNSCLVEIAKLGPLYTRPAQGEPVAWEMDDTAGESGKILVTNDTRVRDEWVRNELPVAPLFGHADPGGVERLRAELAGTIAESQRRRDCCADLIEERNTLRAQLADRDALLWHMAYYLPSALEANAPHMSEEALHHALSVLDAYRKISASAEPSAPQYPRVEIVRAHKHTCACCKEGAEHGPCDCGAVVDGVAVPASAPVEIDERAAFEADFKARYPETMHDIELGKNTEGDYLMTPACFEWEGWQARAALERKPPTTPRDAFAAWEPTGNPIRGVNGRLAAKAGFDAGWCAGWSECRADMERKP